MWFGFGLITLLSAFGYSLYLRAAARWSGDQRMHAGTSYNYQEIRHKQRLQKVRIGVSTPAGFNFTAREEGTRDRFFKWLGVCAELHIRDRAFDQAVYLESDARGLGLLLNEHKELRTALLDIVSLAQSQGLKRLRIRCAHERLWVEFKPKNESVLAGAPGRLVPLLSVLRAGLESNKLRLADMRDPFVWRAAILLSISTATVIFGIYGVLRSTMGRTDILDSWDLLKASAVPGVLALIGFLVVILYTLGRSSRTHLVLVEATLVGGLGFVLSAYAFARDANVDFDQRAATAHELHEVRAEHRITRGRRGRTNHNYYLHTADWRAGHGGKPLALEIDLATFNRLADQQEAIVHVRPGALGYEWIERIEPLDARLEN